MSAFIKESGWLRVAVIIASMIATNAYTAGQYKEQFDQMNRIVLMLQAEQKTASVELAVIRERVDQLTKQRRKEIE